MVRSLDELVLLANREVSICPSIVPLVPPSPLSKSEKGSLGIYCSQINMYPRLAIGEEMVLGGFVYGLESFPALATMQTFPFADEFITRVDNSSVQASYRVYNALREKCSGDRRDLVYAAMLCDIIESHNLVPQYVAFVFSCLSQGERVPSPPHETAQRIVNRNNFEGLGNGLGSTDGKLYRKLLQAYRQFAADGSCAGTQLLHANLRLVFKIALQYRGYSLPREDLVQEGNIGLIKAVRKFDPRIAKFSTHAGMWICQAVNRANKRGSTIRVSEHVHEKRSKLRQLQADFELEFRRAPSEIELEALARDRGVISSIISLADVRIAARTESPLSLSYVPNDDDLYSPLEAFLSDSLSHTPEEDYGSAEKNELIRKGLETLTPREKDILERRLGFRDEEETLEDIGQYYGISGERIRQIEARALGRLRERLKNLAD